jgi:hypothetical protein
MHHPMKKPAILLTTILVSLLFVFTAATSVSPGKKNLVAAATFVDSTANIAAAEHETEAMLYNDLHLHEAGMNQEVFTSAIHGMHKLEEEGVVKKDDVITIIDFSQPSNQKRLYVLDLNARHILFNTLVAHGRNTGTLMAQSFSNDPSSLKSSPGFYTTAETYMGEHGYSLRLDGQERNINDNARNRAVVMHAAEYVDQSAVNAQGFLGRSWGCPAVPVSQHKAIINTIKGGTCLFIYTPDNNYLERSAILNS